MSELKFFVGSALRENWIINEKDILHSKSRLEGYDIFKFCYDPITGEFLCGLWPSFHKEIIELYGQKQFNEYVRGIYFKEKKIVYLRQHANEEWLATTEKFLRAYGISSAIRITWGVAASKELESELKGL